MTSVKSDFKATLKYLEQFHLNVLTDAGEQGVMQDKWLCSVLFELENMT